jgi:hypothetical protein
MPRYIFYIFTLIPRRISCINHNVFKMTRGIISGNESGRNREHRNENVENVLGVGPFQFRFIEDLHMNQSPSFLRISLLISLASLSLGNKLPGEVPRLQAAGVTVTQDQLESGSVRFREIQRQGLMVFATQFNAYDGYGDGPTHNGNTLELGNRVSLQGNGVFLRVHGLDGQSCLECHSVVSNLSVPPVFGIGGFGGSASNAFVAGGSIDPEAPHAGFSGRFINPPALFGAGGVQLLASEMTSDLQALKRKAEQMEGLGIPLESKGVDFGVLRFEDGAFDFSQVEGVDEDLIVRPFGRKGEFSTVRAFDLEALPFHFGIQPTEVVGVNVDEDGDGVANEIGPGPVSALEVFITTLPAPRRELPSGRDKDQYGMERFTELGCAECHRPALITDGSVLNYRFPEDSIDASANVYLRVDLEEEPLGFPSARRGIEVNLFADLKRHDMGEGLGENFGSRLDRMFTTAKLWGVADSAPYMHDGRALTLNSAILMHGGEAQASRDAYDAAPVEERAEVIRFLRSLRSPIKEAADHTKRLSKQAPSSSGRGNGAYRSRQHSSGKHPHRGSH